VWVAVALALPVLASGTRPGNWLADEARAEISCDGGSLLNWSFEEPVIAPKSYKIFNNADIPGWNSTSGKIELWSDGFSSNSGGPVPAPVGNQFAEINATANATMYQDVGTTPGTVIYWSLLHRGRAGVDTMAVLFGPPNDSQLVQQAEFSTGNTDWDAYSGSYTIPPGQTTTRFAFRAVSTATGNQTVGNFIDAISLTTEPCPEPPDCDDASLAPIATPKTYLGNKNTNLTVDALDGVISNDVDPTGRGMQVTAWGNPSHGRLRSLDVDGSFIYEPDQDFVGDDTFEYTVANACGSATAVVTISIQDPEPVPGCRDARNQPKSVPHVYFADLDTKLRVLQADSPLRTDEGGDRHRLYVSGSGSPIAQPSDLGDGTLVGLDRDGTFEYTPPAGFTGTVTIPYTIENACGSDSGEINIQVVDPAPSCKPEDDPVAKDTKYEIYRNQQLTSADPGVMWNDQDPTGTGIVVVAWGPARHGSLYAISEQGGFSYEPEKGFTGQDEFEYTIANQCGESTALVKIDVLDDQPPGPDCQDGDMPKAGKPSYAVTEGGRIETDKSTGVLYDSSGGGNYPLAVTGWGAVSPDGAGTLDQTNENGAFRFIASSGYSGEAQFRFTVANECGEESGVATISVQQKVTPPVAPNYTEKLRLKDENKISRDANNGLLSGVDTNGCGGEAVIDVSQPKHGQVDWDADGSFTYTPDKGYTGKDQFDYTVRTDCGEATGAVSIDVEGDNGGGGGGGGGGSGGDGGGGNGGNGGNGGGGGGGSEDPLIAAAEAGDGGAADGAADGGAIATGDWNTGGNAGDRILVGDTGMTCDEKSGECWGESRCDPASGTCEDATGDVWVEGGDIANGTTGDLGANGGLAASDAASGDLNAAHVGDGDAIVTAPSIELGSAASLPEDQVIAAQPDEDSAWVVSEQNAAVDDVVESADWLVSEQPAADETAFTDSGLAAASVIGDGPISSDQAIPAPGGCVAYATWLDAQTAFEAGLDASIDPDGDGIACEDMME
jgi:hypothetical protein